MDHQPLLEIKALSTQYTSRGGLFRASVVTKVLDNFSLDVFAGETLGLVGESGCGKTTLILSLLRLVAASAGSILLDGEDVARAGGQRLRYLRRQMQVVFQNPYSSLDPHMTVSELVGEPLVVHSRSSRVERFQQVATLLADVGLDPRAVTFFPHQLSGGQAQRVALARALALKPRLLLLDEPTSALDVSVQAQVLNLLVELQQRHGLTYVFVSHDLSVVQHISNRIAVMYLGEIVELGPTEQVFNHPQHPYTRALLAAATPSTDARRLPRLPSTNPVPSFANIPDACRYHTRCPFVMDKCRTTSPPRYHAEDAAHWARCHLLDGTHPGYSMEVAHEPGS